MRLHLPSLVLALLLAAAAHAKTLKPTSLAPTTTGAPTITGAPHTPRPSTSLRPSTSARPTTSKHPTPQPTHKPTKTLFLVSAKIVARMSPLENASYPNEPALTVEVQNMEYEANVHFNRTVHSKWHTTDARGSITVTGDAGTKMTCKPKARSFKLSHDQLGLFILAADGPGWHPVNAHVAFKGAVFSARLELHYSNGKVVHSPLYQHSATNDPQNLPPGWVPCKLPNDDGYVYAPQVEYADNTGWHIPIFQSKTYAPSPADKSRSLDDAEATEVWHHRPATINVLGGGELAPEDF